MEPTLWKFGHGIKIGSSMNKKTFRKLIQKFVPTNEIYTLTTNDVKEFKIGKNFIYKFNYSFSRERLKLYNELTSELNKIELSNASIAFKKNLSYLHFFEPHSKNYNFLRLDIRSFFHSIKIEDIRESFKNYIDDDRYIDEGETESFLETFINIVTYKIPSDSINKNFRNKQILPMGLPTSPVISNIIFRRLDIQIQKLCSKHNIVYTRYADDMLFSSSKDSIFVHSNSFINELQIILFQMKFILNKKKTLKAKHTLSLNGYTIQYNKKCIDELGEEKIISLHELRISNKKTNIINKMIYMIEDEDKSPELILKKLFNFTIEWNFEPTYSETFEKFYKEQLLHKVLGYRSYLLSIIQFNKKYHCTQVKSINKYLVIINKLEKISEQYQNRIDELENIIREKKFFVKINNIAIEDLSLTDWLCGLLIDEGYKTLYDLYEVKEKELVERISGIGKTRAKGIVEIISREVGKYK